MTISNIFLKNNNLYFIDFNQKNLEPITAEALTHNNKYNLIISDQYFFYLSIDIPTKTKNIRNIIWNCLKAHFPELLVSNFGFVSYKNSVIVFIFNDKLKNFIEDNSYVFKRAKRISTPFLELCSRKDKFLYKVEQIIYDFNNGTIELSFDVTSTPISEEDIIFTLQQLENNIEISIIKKKIFTKKEIFSLVSVLIVSYSMFFAANIFRLKSTHLIYEKYNNIITKLYQQAGVINYTDPYGELLYKVNKVTNKLNKYRVSKILYNFTISCPHDCVINSISYQQNIVICYGYTTQLSKLDKLRSNLQTYFSRVEIENTSKQNNKVNFSLKCKL